jgi:F-type H+-transporting ATPase subunit delta
MAELATIARPYAEAMFKASAGGDLPTLSAQVDALAVVAADPELRQFADNPNVLPAQVFELVTGVANLDLAPAARNLLQTMIDNGRLAALPQVAEQFRKLVNARGGVSDAVIQSAFPIDEAQLAEVVATLERRFGRRLNAHVEIDPELIGGIRAVVGDEVLDTSVKARLEQMKVALAA